MFHVERCNSRMMSSVIMTFWLGKARGVCDNTLDIGVIGNMLCVILMIAMFEDVVSICDLVDYQRSS